jgi:hypothetical protein
VPQLQGVQGRSCSCLPRALGNAEDGVASAFPKGKENENIFLNDNSSARDLYILKNITKWNMATIFNTFPLFLILFTIN